MLKFMSFFLVLLLFPQMSLGSYMWGLITGLLFFLSATMLTYFPLGMNLISSNLSFFFLDGMSIPLIILTLWVSGLMVMSSFSVKLKSSGGGVFIFNLLCLNSVLMFCFMASNLMLFYVMFEGSLIPTMIMILVWGYQPERLQASSYFVVYTVMASLPFLISLMMIFNENNSLTLILSSWSSPVLVSVGGMWWLVTILAFLVKLPLYSVHLWLPKAHVEAPVAGSMILAAVLLKLGGYGLMRVTSLFPELSISLIAFLSSLSMLGACITSAICLRQPDMKSMIAYSSVGHMGFVIIGVLSFSSWGWAGSLGLMVAHGLCSSALFSIANMVYESIGSRSMVLIKGLMTIFPCMSIWWFVLCAANMSGPPSFNLFGEIMLLGAVLMSSFWLSGLFVISAFLVGAFSLFLFTSTQHGSLSNFLNPFSYSCMRNYKIMILHSFPLYFLLLHPYGFFWGV